MDKEQKIEYLHNYFIKLIETELDLIDQIIKAPNEDIKGHYNLALLIVDTLYQKLALAELLKIKEMKND